MNKFNLIDFGNIGKPASEVVNNFVDKISNALGWFVSPKGIKPAVMEANKSIIEEISNRQDIHPIERAAIISNYKRIVKEYKNQLDIMQLAVDHLSPDSKPEEISDDWIEFFFDKVKNVSEDDMKVIWSKILAGEFNEPKTYTKQLIHILSIMDSKLAGRFQKIRSSCFYSSPLLYLFIYRTNRSNINNIKRYQDMGIYISDLKELDSLGLIQHRFSDFHTLIVKNKVFDYGNKRVRLDTDKRSMALGNVTLTNAGKQLCRISPMVYDDQILDLCVESWKKLGYNPIVETIEKKPQ